MQDSTNPSPTRYTAPSPATTPQYRRERAEIAAEMEQGDFSRCERFTLLQSLCFFDDVVESQL